MSRYRISREAQRDLKDIIGYIARDNPKAAMKVRDAIYAKFAMLGRQPLIGEIRDELGPDLRSFPVGNYVIYYVPASGFVRIVRVLHGARDVGPLFGQGESGE